MESMDPTEPLIDLTVVGGKPVFRIEEVLLGCPCSGVGWLGQEWVYQREPQCTCGAGDPEDINVLHDVSCDSVPCPFCPAEYKARHTFEGEE
jgi:hypothetical protein